MYWGVQRCVSTVGHGSSDGMQRKISASSAVRVGYYPSDWSTDDPAQNCALADYNNERLGVTREQRLAMECGSMHGWNVPGANPKAYEQNGMKMGGMTLG